MSFGLITPTVPIIISAPPPRSPRSSACLVVDTEVYPGQGSTVLPALGSPACVGLGGKGLKSPLITEAGAAESHWGSTLRVQAGTALKADVPLGRSEDVVGLA